MDKLAKLSSTLIFADLQYDDDVYSYDHFIYIFHQRHFQHATTPSLNSQSVVMDQRDHQMAVT